METVRAHIAYRPLRIAWLVERDDFDSMRQAVRINHTLWGGQYNPLIVIDDEHQGRELVEVFRADLIRAIRPTEKTKVFAEQYKHLYSFLHSDGVHFGTGDQARSQVLDVQNLAEAVHEDAEWKHFKEAGPRIYGWDQQDSMRDVFLMRFGAYPDLDIVPIDYLRAFREALNATELRIDAESAIPADVCEHPTISTLSRFRVEPHHGMHASWDYDGFFMGDPANFDDLVCYWNLRAAGRAVIFINIQNIDRHRTEIPLWWKRIEDELAQRANTFGRGVALWWTPRSLDEELDEQVTTLISNGAPFIACPIRQGLWNGLNLVPPMMHLSEAHSLGQLDSESEHPKVSFVLNERPHASHAWFHTQLLVASLWTVGGLYKRNLTLQPPYIPELNEFYGREMIFGYDQFRVEPERVGIIVKATDTDIEIAALQGSKLFERMFALAGFSARVSSSGLVVRQLIAQMGGLQGARAFKILGVRRLIKTYGPTESFAQRGALQLIGSRDPNNPDAAFENHSDLHIATRPPRDPLTPSHVFSHLVNKGLFRIGLDLTCPRCQLVSWFTIDGFSQRSECPLCGDNFDATKQLVASEWSYRRSGILGIERNARGAVPVALTLQQLDTALSGDLQKELYSVSLDLTRTDNKSAAQCEVDFVWMLPQRYPDRTTLLIGECKDRGRTVGNRSDGGTINAKDIENLKTVADAFPTHRFEIFIMFTKLCAFTTEELELIGGLNDDHRCRVILLTDRELEPYNIFSRTAKLFTVDEYCRTPRDLAAASVNIFLRPKLRQ